MPLARAGSFALAVAVALASVTGFAADRRVGASGAGVGNGTGGAVTTLEQALVQAYQNNPQINAQRALVRATDENVPQALSGYRPRISGSYNYGVQWTE